MQAPASVCGMFSHKQGVYCLPHYLYLGVPRACFGWALSQGRPFRLGMVGETVEAEMMLGCVPASHTGKNPDAISTDTLETIW